MVSSSALKTLSEAKWNTPQLLPFTEDVRKMHIYMDKKTERDISAAYKTGIVKELERPSQSDPCTTDTF